MEDVERNSSEFSENVNLSARQYKQIFTDVQEHLRNDFAKRPEGERGGFLVALRKLKKSLPVQSSVAYLNRSTHPNPRPPKNIRQTAADINRIKSRLKNVFATPKDLSKFYKTLRDRENMMFGDVVNAAVQGVYEMQPPEKHSLLDQVIYLKEVSRMLFPEIKDATAPADRVIQGGALQRRGDESREMRVTRALQEDFDMLGTMQVTGDYFRSSFEQASGMKLFVPGMTKTQVFTRMAAAAFTQRKTSAFQDIPHIAAFVDYVGDINETPTYKRIVSDYPASLQTLAYVETWNRAHRHLLQVAGRTFTDETVNSIVSTIPPSKWEDIQFSREAPSCQRTFFDKNTDPLLMCVDPAPGKAYVATVSFTHLAQYQSLVQEMGSVKTARELINPLQRPFKEKEFLESIMSLAFYVRKSDGELSMYGDSTPLARAQLGKNYEICKRLVHYALYNLTHAEYVPREETGEERELLPPLSTPAPRPRTIPTHPAERAIPSEEPLRQMRERSFLGREAHNRLLPVGWLPGFKAWQRARVATETIELFAKVFDESNSRPSFDIKLDVGDNYKKFRESLLNMQLQYGERIRFQTYVSATEEESEDSEA